MSGIKKGERKESKLQTIHTAYKIRKQVTQLAENNFFMNIDKINEVVAKSTIGVQDEKRKRFIAKKVYDYYGKQIERVTKRVIDSACGISYHLRIANTIFPTYMSEFEERRLEMDRAMACCNTLQDELQYAGECLHSDLNRFTNLVLEIQKEFNAIKSLRQSDNRFLKEIKSK